MFNNLCENDKSRSSRQGKVINNTIHRAYFQAEMRRPARLRMGPVTVPSTYGIHRSSVVASSEIL